MPLMRGKYCVRL